MNKALWFAVIIAFVTLSAPPQAIAQDFIRAPNGTFWKIDVGLKRLFTSAESIQGHGLNIESAINVSQEQFDNYPLGEPMTTRKIFRRSVNIHAQHTETVRIPMEGWILIDGPHVENGDLYKVENEFDSNGNIIALRISAHNPNANIVGLGKARTVIFKATLEKK